MSYVSLACSGRMYLMVVILAIAIQQQLATDDIHLISIVDDERLANQNDQISLADAVEYINLPDTNILMDHTLQQSLVHANISDAWGSMTQVCSLLPGGADLLLDLSPRPISRLMRSTAEGNGIAHISLIEQDPLDVENMTSTSLNILPPCTTILKIIRDIVITEHLNNVAILYDNTFDLGPTPYNLLQNIASQHVYLKLPHKDDEDAMKEQLKDIKETQDISHLFMAADPDIASRYLGVANAQEMMTFQYNWYIITQGATLGCNQCRRDSRVVVITGKTEFNAMNTYVEFMNDKLQDRNMYFNRENVDMASAFQFDILSLVGKAFDDLMSEQPWVSYNYSQCHPNTEVNVASQQQATSLVEQIQSTTYDGVFGAIQWHDGVGEQDITMELKSIRFLEGSSESEKLLGNWSSSARSLNVNGSISTSDIKKNYRVITVVEPPFVFKSKQEPEKKEGLSFEVYKNVTTGYYYYGYCIDLIYKIADDLQFDFTLYEPEDGSYGTMQEDGSWNGIVKDLMDEKADIAVASLSVMAERENVIDFTVPYYDLVGITILMSKPKFEYSVFKFMTVLEEAVWGCVFSAFIIVSVLIAIFDKYSPYSYQNNKSSWDGEGEEPRVFTLKEGLWFCMTSLTPQGGGEAPRALSGRLVAATWWMFGFIMIATYTANLAAFLTVSRLDQPIESLDDLAKQFKTKYSPQSATSTETYFKRMAQIEDKFYTIWKAMSLNDSLNQVERAKLAVWDYPVSDKFTNMWEAMKDSKFPSTFEEAINRIKHPHEGEEDYAFIGDATQNKYATLTDCELWEVGEEFSRKPYALAVPNGSSMKTTLSSVLLQLLNQRFLEDLKMKWWDFNKSSCPKIEDESDGISIHNIGGVFLVIFIGIGFGLITLGFEYYWYKWRPAAKRRQDQAAAVAGGMSGSVSGGAPVALHGSIETGELTMNGSASGAGHKDPHGHDNLAYDR